MEEWTCSMENVEVIDMKLWGGLELVATTS